MVRKPIVGGELQLRHVGMVWPLLERMNVTRIVNQHLPADPSR